EKLRAPILALFGGERERGPEVRRVRNVEAARHHADDGVARAVETDRLADDGAVARVPPIPKRMAEDDDLVAPAVDLVGGEPAAEERLDAQRVEEPGRHLVADDVLGVAVAGERDLPVLIRDHVLE